MALAERTTGRRAAPQGADPDAPLLWSPEQALGREDRPLIHWGLDWTWTQTKWVLWACGVAFAWLLVWSTLALLTRAVLSPQRLGWSVPWLLLPWLACAVVGRLGVRWQREGTDGRERAIWAWRWRALRHGTRYGPGAGGWAYQDRVVRVRVGSWTPGPWTVLVPVRQPGSAAALLDAGELDAGGLVCQRERGVERWTAWLDLGPVILRGMPPARQEAVFGALETLLRALPDGRRVQFCVQNRARGAAGINAALDRRQTSVGPGRRTLRAERRRWVVREYEGAYAPDATYSLVVDGATRAEALRRREEAAAALGQVGVGVAVPSAALVAARVAEAATGQAEAGAGADMAALTVDASDATRVVLGGEGDAPVLLQTLLVRGWPAHTPVETLFSLPLLPVPSRVVYTFEGRAQQAAGQEVADRAAYMRSSDRNKRRRAARQMAAEGGALLVVASEGDAALQHDAEDLDAVYADVRAGATGLVWVGLTLGVYGRDAGELARGVAVAHEALVTRAGCVADLLPGTQLALYRASQPCARAPYRPLAATTRTARVLFPALKETAGHPPPAPDAGDQSYVLLGRSMMGGQAVFFRWGAMAAKSVILLGDQGMGKSFAMGGLIEAAVQEGDDVSVLDPSGSFVALCDVLGGSRIDLLAPGVAVNLLELAGAKAGNRVLALLDVFETILGDGVVERKLDGWTTAALDQGLRFTFAQATRRSSWGGPAAAPGTPLLRYLAVWLRRQERRARAVGERAEASRYRELRQTLQPYYGAGSFASLMDRPTTADLENQVVVVDTAYFAKQQGAIAGLGLVVATAVADARAVRATAAGRAHRIFVDEMYSVLRLALRWFAGMGRTIRHDNNSFCGATHRLSDIVALPEGETLLTSIRTWIIVGMTDDAAVLERSLDLPRPVALRVRHLTRVIDGGAQALFCTKLAEQSGWQYGFCTLLQYPVLGELLKSYVEQKQARAAAAQRAGGLLKAAQQAARARERGLGKERGNV